MVEVEQISTGSAHVTWPVNPPEPVSVCPAVVQVPRATAPVVAPVDGERVASFRT